MTQRDSVFKLQRVGRMLCGGCYSLSQADVATSPNKGHVAPPWPRSRSMGSARPGFFPGPLRTYPSSSSYSHCRPIPPTLPKVSLGPEIIGRLPVLQGVPLGPYRMPAPRWPPILVSPLSSKTHYTHNQGPSLPVNKKHDTQAQQDTRHVAVQTDTPNTRTDALPLRRAARSPPPERRSGSAPPDSPGPPPPSAGAVPFASPWGSQRRSTARAAAAAGAAGGLGAAAGRRRGPGVAWPPAARQRGAGSRGGDRVAERGQFLAPPRSEAAAGCINAPFTLALSLPQYLPPPRHPELPSRNRPRAPTPSRAWGGPRAGPAPSYCSLTACQDPRGAAQTPVESPPAGSGRDGSGQEPQVGDSSREDSAA